MTEEKKVEAERISVESMRIYRYHYSLPGKVVDLMLTMPPLSEEECSEVEELFRLIIQVQRRRHSHSRSVTPATDELRDE